MSKSVVKVELTQDDGTVLILKGDEARKWMLAVDGQAAFCAAHGNPFPELAWVTEPPAGRPPVVIKPLDAVAAELLSHELEYLHEQKVESILIVYRGREDGAVELGAISSSPAKGEVPVAPSMAHVKYLLDLAYNAISSVATKRLDDPS